jgi:hypothetical protein
MERMGVVRSAVFDLEEREETGSITLRSLGRMAEAMGCKVVYGIVPANGKTLEEMAEERLWRRVIGGDSKPASRRVGKSANSAAADVATNKEAA